MSRQERRNIPGCYEHANITDQEQKCCWGVNTKITYRPKPTPWSHCQEKHLKTVKNLGRFSQSGSKKGDLKPQYQDNEEEGHKLLCQTQLWRFDSWAKQGCLVVEWHRARALNGKVLQSVSSLNAWGLSLRLYFFPADSNLVNSTKLCLGFLFPEGAKQSNNRAKEQSLRCREVWHHYFSLTQ